MKKISRVVALMSADILFMLASSFLALFVRFEFSLKSIDHTYINTAITYAPIYIISTVIIFAIFHLYNSMWSYASVDEMFFVITASVISGITTNFGMFILQLPIPRSYPFLCGIFLLMFTAGTRFFYRFMRLKKKAWNKEGMKRTLVIGAGQAGYMTIKEFNYSKHSQNNVVCIVDDDVNKQGQLLQGKKVVGDTTNIPQTVKKYNIDEIVLAIPTLSTVRKKELLEICSSTDCTLKTLPGIYQLVNGDVSIQQIRNVEIEDLLGRSAVTVDINGIGSIVNDKTVLVTGGGGSIGSELCRQLASYTPSLLIIFDIYENNAYEVQMELNHNFPGLNLKVLIGSVRDKNRVDEVFDKYRPDVVFHAAAHKHVPLMEESPHEAVKNNIDGTYNVATAADKYDAGLMCLVSTDKAVNPTNVMGASKRCCEMIVQMMNRKSATRYVAVRFGNVLGSHGSVVPLFKKQIAEGGPVTVTHKDIIRYFMTIPEAVSLILQAAVYADGGEIFVLDMGDPVKIDDLARKMIRLSGFEPDIDIDIVYTGLRPGEKLFEELLLREEGLTKTDNDLIYIGHDIGFDETTLEKKLNEINQIPDSDKVSLRKKLGEIVPTYHKGTS